MKTSKKQIFIVERLNYLDQRIKVSMVTTSIRKLKKFIIKQILNNNSDIFYNNEKMNKTAQVKEFNSDWKNLTRDEINKKLYGLKYDYVYDGEEF